MNNNNLEAQIEAFLLEQKAHITEKVPFLLHLFKDGITDRNIAGLRISETIKEFPILKGAQNFFYELYDNAMRVPHWHANCVEIGVVLNGHMRITIWNGPGDFSQFTVEKGGVWFIPQGAAHCLENMGTERLDFLVAYNSEISEDRDFSTAWSSLPEVVLEKSLGLEPQDIQDFKKSTLNRLSLYDPAAKEDKGDIPHPYRIIFSQIDPIYNSELGMIKRVDQTNWNVMNFMAMQQTFLKPGTIREPHWYTKSNVLLFVRAGKAFFNMMDSDGNVYKFLIETGDLVFIPIGIFHTFINIGSEDLEIYETFTTSAPFHEIGLLDASQHFNAGTLAGATGLTLEAIKKIKKKKTHSFMLAF